MRPRGLAVPPARTGGPNNGAGSHMQRAASQGTCQRWGQDPVPSPARYLAPPLPLSAPIPGLFLFGCWTDRCPPSGWPPRTSDSSLLEKRLGVIAIKLHQPCWAEGVLTERPSFQHLAFSLLEGGRIYHLGSCEFTVL